MSEIHVCLSHSTTFFLANVQKTAVCVERRCGFINVDVPISIYEDTVNSSHFRYIQLEEMYAQRTSVIQFHYFLCLIEFSFSTIRAVDLHTF